MAGHARQRPFAWLLLVTGAIGWIASSILVLERIATYVDPSYVTSCDVSPWVSCGAVFQTWQAALFGFPNPLIGIVAFAVPITTAMALLAGARFRRWYWLGLQTGVTLGFIFVVWLWSQALFDIFILCIYCMVVWAMMIPMFVMVTVRNLAHGVIRAPEGVVRFASDWAWTITAVLWIATAASVFIRFMNAFLGG
ncbi:hypothetical protein D477_005301 [Arthrobacter crystallopoietes BAB-32]|uniref:Vitamin K epoxide reductase domain-containing protein n=1 Tax=Arthrobacter crystallopoietes BAB-32 TaxID=1246476 RepID=N1VAH6_9MICC|nr:hypothetical protein D477_005301 [Arthrobacter crystallopoietes BAB-32]